MSKFIIISRHRLFQFHPFPASVPILNPLKTPDNQRFSWVFRKYKMGALARNKLRKLESKNLRNINMLFYCSTFVAFRNM